MRIAYQGEPGAFSHEAAGNFWKNVNNLSFAPQKEFAAVFDTVKSGEADFGILPIENSITGSIHDNMDLFLRYQLVITGEYILRIEHHLLAQKNAELSDIRIILSHPQGLLQCSSFLKTLPGVEARAVYDTAGAAKTVMENTDNTMAAIASRRAAAEYGLTVRCSNIENNHANYTRFLIISKKQVCRNPDKSSIVFSTGNNPGSLFKCLAVFSLRDINLLKIESRPIVGKPWQYLFYLDFSGTIEDTACSNALKHLEEFTEHIKFLGSYPGFVA